MFIYLIPIPVMIFLWIGCDFEFFLYLHYAVMAHVEIIVIIASPTLCQGYLYDLTNEFAYLAPIRNQCLGKNRTIRTIALRSPTSDSGRFGFTQTRNGRWWSLSINACRQYLNDLRWATSPDLRARAWLTCSACAYKYRICVSTRCIFENSARIFANVKIFTDVCNAVLWRIAAPFLPHLLFWCWMLYSHYIYVTQIIANRRSILFIIESFIHYYIPIIQIEHISDIPQSDRYI